MVRISRLWKDRVGATSIEYALIASLISVAAMTGYYSLCGKLQTSFNNTADTVGDAM